MASPSIAANAYANLARIVDVGVRRQILRDPAGSRLRPC